MPTANAHMPAPQPPTASQPGCFALYRLPYADSATLVWQHGADALPLADISLINRSHPGFVVAPFVATARCPVLLIRPDRVTTLPLDDAAPSVLHRLLPTQPAAVAADPCDTPLATPTARRAAYAADFACFHSQLRAGRFSKLVLSRCADEQLPSNGDAVDLFLQACRSYPRLFIALVSTSQSGLWLTATPELLLEGSHAQWRTIALAGTMRLADDELADGDQRQQWSTQAVEELWSAKDREEQHIVAAYVSRCLSRCAADVREEGPRTVRAANLLHLRSDFTFALSPDVSPGQLLSLLHPTPAVCGLPEEEARRFILTHEHTPRRYYSGFMGPFALGGATHLYVSLRCMHIDASACHLYAGGGLLPASTEEQEWQETEAKLETMRRLLSS